MLESIDTLIAFTLIMLVVSLIITVCVQMMSGLINLRGRNLAKGLGEAFKTVVPGMDDRAKALARHILQGPLISESSFKHWPPCWRIATAVRPDEVFDAIHRIAIGKREAPAEMVATARRLLAGLGVDEAALTHAQATAADVAKTISEANAAATRGLELIPDPQARADAQQALAAVTNRLEADAARIAQTVADAGTQTLENAYARFKYWCDIAQERVAQWFALHTRIITVLLAFVFAFALQLDTAEIFQRVARDRVLRDKLVAQSSAITAHAERVLVDQRDLVDKALTEWRAQQTPEVQQTVADVVVEPATTRWSLRRQLAKTLADVPQRDELLRSFDEAVDAIAAAQLKKGGSDYGELKSDLDNTGFALFPTEGYRWGDRFRDGWSLRHVVGVLFSVCLLSLGAPFWYNILKGLSSLRSVVAQNISAEKDQARQLGVTNDQSAPPPTVVAPPK
jgi:hypothetical protein